MARARVTLVEEENACGAGHLVVMPRRQQGGRYGGGRQAPVLQPSMIGKLDQLLEAMAGTPQWSVMMGVFCMMIALIRFAHL